MNAYCVNNPIMISDPAGCCYIARKTSAGTYIGTYWTIITAVPGVPNFCYNCKQYKPNTATKNYIEPVVTESFKKSASLPPTGPPNSKLSLYDSEGSLKQERWYGPDGIPIRDRDFKHPGNMEFPHDHEWIDGERQTDHLPPSPDYKITWDYNPSSEFGFDLSDYYNPPTGEKPFWETLWQYFSTIE